MENKVDICSICGNIGKYGTFVDVNAVDFEILCPDCKNCRCNNCLRLKSFDKLGNKRYHCGIRGTIENPNKKVCDYWKSEMEEKLID